jgi:hypothetical protein
MAAGKKVRDVVAVATSDGSVVVTVATAAGVGTERYPAPSVQARETHVARIASELARASRGAAGTIPLAAAARVPAYGG